MPRCGWGPDYDRSGAKEKVICKTATTDYFGSGGAAALPCGPHVAG